MYRTVLPRCTVVGSVEPVPYSHFMNGAVPSKCRTCAHLFEGGCRRALEQVGKYLALDHGPCPVRGPTNPVVVETEHYTSKVLVPAKCERCRYLELEKVRGFVCNFERERWGAFPRTLDWGAWSPEHPNIGLKSGRSVSQEVLRAVAARREVEAIKAFRAAHRDVTHKEAREAYAELLEQVSRNDG
jgi:hypothetical protein